MQAAAIGTFGIDICKVFTGSSVCKIAHFVSGEIIQIHFAHIRVVSKNVFIKLHYFFELFDMGFNVAVVLIHNLAAQRHVFHIALGKVYENGWSLDDEPNVDSKAVT